MATQYTAWMYHTSTCSFRIAAVENSVDIQNNRTNVTFSLQVKYTQDNVLPEGWLVSGTFTITIDGSTYTHTQDDVFYYPNPGDEFTIFSRTVNITHSSDGTKTVNVAGTADMRGGGVFSSGTKSITLTPIVRKNTITSITGGTIGGNMTVTINKPNASSTTSVWVALGNSGWVSVASNQSGSSISFTVPKSLASQLPNSVNGTGSVHIRTHYNGSDIGDDSWSKEFIVPDSMGYSITDVTRNTDTEINGQLKWVQGKSKLRINIFTDNTNAYGATIIEYKFTFDGKTYYGNNTWTGVINSSGFKAIKATITDSRGRTVTYDTGISVYEYKNPLGSITGYRCDKNGNRNDTEGTYFKLRYSAANSSVDGANTFAALIESKEAGSTTWHEVEWTPVPVENKEVIAGSVEYPYPLDKVFSIRLTVKDWFTESVYIINISTADVLLDFRAGGTGVGIGMICTKDNTIQTNKVLQIFPGYDKGQHNTGADCTFCNVSDESQNIGINGGVPTTDNLLSIYRYTQGSGSSGRLMLVDKWNDCYYNFKMNYFANKIIFYSRSGSDSEEILRYNDSNTYFYFHNPNTNSHGVGAYHSNTSGIWHYNATGKQLTLKYGYGNTSDRRLKYDPKEFEDWDSYYNFYMSLKPQTFKYNDDMRDETYIGLIAQDVHESVNKSLLHTEKLCLVKDDEDAGYTIAYEELIPLNIKMIQKHENDIQELKNKVALFKETANKLKKN